MSVRRYPWLEKLHAAHYVTLLRLAQNRLFAMTGSSSEAEDVVQDVFVLAAEKDIQHLENPLRWLMKATVNLCHERTRRAYHETEKGQRLVRAKLDHSADRSVLSFERQESETEALELLLALEQTLSPEDWNILRLYCLEKVPIDELSAKLNLPINTLRVRICRIRKKYQKIFPDL